MIFPLYINDLSSVVTDCLLGLYADDAELHCNYLDLCTVQRCLQSDLCDVAAWLCSSCLYLNVSKSNLMLIGSHQRVANKTLHVSVGGKTLTLFNTLVF